MSELSNPNIESRPRDRRRVGLAILLMVIAALIALRLALPSYVRDKLNQQLATMGAYSGHVDDVEIHLWRGAYSIDNLQIWKSSGKVRVPLLKAPVTDISISWREIFHGAIVARVRFDRPELNFVDADKKNEEQGGGGVDWRAQLQQIIPIRLNEVEIADGTLRFQKFDSKLPVNANMKNIQLVVRDLTNVRQKKINRPASIQGKAVVMDQAPLELNGNFDPFVGLDDFSIDLKLSKLDLVRLNNLLRAYLWLDVASGQGEFVMQLDVHQRKVTGYVKPLFRNIQVVDWSTDIKNDNPVRLAWKALAGTVVTLFKNQNKDQFAARTEISGSLDNPDAGVWDTIGSILHNAFVKALTPTFENTK